MEIVTKKIKGKICLELLVSNNDGDLNNVGERLKGRKVILNYHITSKRKFPFFRKEYKLWVDIGVENIRHLALDFYEKIGGKIK